MPTLSCSSYVHLFSSRLLGFSFRKMSKSTTEQCYDLLLHQPMFTYIISISRLLIYSVLKEAYECIQFLQIAVDRQTIFALHDPQVLVVCRGRCGRTMTTTQQIGWFKTSKPLKLCLHELHSHRMDSSKNEIHLFVRHMICKCGTSLTFHAQSSSFLVVLLHVWLDP